MPTDTKDGVATFRKTTLDSGIRVVTGSMPHARSVCVSVFVGVGSRYESEEHAGISHVIEHLVFKGTKRRPTPGEISGTVEGVGGEVNAGTEQELTVYWCRVARPYLEMVLDLLIDMLRNSLFEAREIESERMVLIEEQAMTKDYPNDRADALIDELLWPEHPLGRDISGTKESITNITRDMIIDHVSQFYTPSNIVVSVAGNVEHEGVARQLDSLCDGWPQNAAPQAAPFSHSQSEPRLRLEYRKTEQLHLAIGVPGLSLVHPERYALGLLSAALGEGMSSRLFLEVREKRGLAYDIHSGLTHFQDCGALVINAAVDPSKAETAVQTILAETSRLKDGIAPDELEKAKRLSTGRLMLRMEDTRAVSAWMGSQELLLGTVTGVDEVVDSVNRVTPEEITRVSNGLLMTEKLNMAVVGPRRGQRRLQRLLRL